MGGRAPGQAGRLPTTAQVNPRLAALTAAGTSVLLDQIRRSLIESAELERLVREDSLRGVTSNPAIFEKAILGSSDYDGQIAEFLVYNDQMSVNDINVVADHLSFKYDLPFAFSFGGSGGSPSPAPRSGRRARCSMHLASTASRKRHARSFAPPASRADSACLMRGNG